MILFDVLSDVLFFKKGEQLQTMDSESEVNPYMLNRWISMHSPANAKIVNAINNKYWAVFQNRKDWYRLNLTLLPRNRFVKIEYVKKAAKDKTAAKKDDNEKIYEMLSKNLELSLREVKLYIEASGVDLTSYRKILKNEKN